MASPAIWRSESVRVRERRRGGAEGQHVKGTVTAAAVVKRRGDIELAANQPRTCCAMAGLEGEQPAEAVANWGVESGDRRFGRRTRREQTKAGRGSGRVKRRRSKSTTAERGRSERGGGRIEQDVQDVGLEGPWRKTCPISGVGLAGEAGFGGPRQISGRRSDSLTSGFDSWHFLAPASSLRPCTVSWWGGCSRHELSSCSPARGKKTSMPSRAFGGLQLHHTPPVQIALAVATLAHEHPGNTAIGAAVICRNAPVRRCGGVRWDGCSLQLRASS